MSGLEQSYYIIGIVFMSVVLVLITVIVVSLVVIRNKVVALEKNVADKLHAAVKLPEKIVEIATAVQELGKAIK